MKEFKLENEPKITAGFKTPDHYFDTFSAKVLEQINEREVKVIPLYKRKKSHFDRSGGRNFYCLYDSYCEPLL
ncbi:hypothetical protein AAFH68_32140 [Flavobacterium sp. CGRL1]